MLFPSWGATISGYVTDSFSGKSIPNANVIIKETGNGIGYNWAI